MLAALHPGGGQNQREGRGKGTDFVLEGKYHSRPQKGFSSGNSSSFSFCGPQEKTSQNRRGLTVTGHKNGLPTETIGVQPRTVVYKEIIEKGLNWIPGY